MEWLTALEPLLGGQPLGGEDAPLTLRSNPHGNALGQVTRKKRYRGVGGLRGVGEGVVRAVDGEALGVREPGEHQLANLGEPGPAVGTAVVQHGTLGPISMGRCELPFQECGGTDRARAEVR